MAHEGDAVKKRMLSRTGYEEAEVLGNLSTSIAGYSDSHTPLGLRSCCGHLEAEAAFTTSAPDLHTSPYLSARIQSLTDSRGNFADHLEFEIHSSKSHWTDLSQNGNQSEDMCSDDEEKESNQVVFERLKEHVEWGPFFRRSRYDLEIGEKIAEGGQAEIFAASGSNVRDGTRKDLVVKVFKEGYFLQDLQRLWPPGLAQAALPYRYFTVPNRLSDEKGNRLCWALDVQLLTPGDRVAFVFERYWGDLRKLIDMRKLESNDTPPFCFRTTVEILLRIAKGMASLHKFGLLHRDLKAANVLVENENDSTDYFHKNCPVVAIADFESSVGTQGTGFWRAPEMLLALRTCSSKLDPESFTQQADVYSYGMTCFEVMTGCLPFEGRSLRDWDGVLGGERPTLPDDTSPILVELVRKCWHEDPLQRPSFDAIVQTLVGLVSFADILVLAGDCIFHEYTAGFNNGVKLQSTNAIPVRSFFGQSSLTGVLTFLRKRLHSRRGELGNERVLSGYHWTELRKESTCDTEERERLSGLEVYERLEKYRPHLDVIRYCNWVIGKKIGEGGEAEVYECLNLANSGSSWKYVMKVFKVGYPLQSLLQMRSFPLKDWYNYTCHRSWNISCNLGAIYSRDKGIALISHRHWGDLRTFLDHHILNNEAPSRKHPFSFDTILWLMLNIAMGMRKLHSMGILHKDLKSSNILLGAKRGDLKSSCIYISDFESSAATAGTGLWRAPEILRALRNGSLNADTFTAQSDVYSYAMTCYEIITGDDVPFDCDQPSESEYDAVIFHGKRPTLPDWLPLPIDDLIRQCWHEDPGQRPCFEVIARKLDRLTYCELPLRS